MSACGPPCAPKFPGATTSAGRRAGLALISECGAANCCAAPTGERHSISSTTSFSQPNWPAWRHSGTASVDGVGCAQSETCHTHALLTVYRNGVRLALPDSIGRGTGCNYEMHTHDGSGVLHIETDVPRTFTLGQFLSLWGQGIGAGSVLGMPGPAQYYVISNETITPVTTDPAALPLTAHTEIVVILGTPPAALPRYDWPGSGL